MEDKGDMPALEALREGLAGEVIEGGPSLTSWNESARDSVYYPFESLTRFLLFVFVSKYQLSRVARKDPFDTVMFMDGEKADGCGKGTDFRGTDVPEDPEHFISRFREYLPVLEVREREVARNHQRLKEEGSVVYDMPINLQLVRPLESPGLIHEMHGNPGGHTLRRDEIRGSPLGSDHIFPISEIS